MGVLVSNERGLSGSCRTVSVRVLCPGAERCDAPIFLPPKCHPPGFLKPLNTLRKPAGQARSRSSFGLTRLRRQRARRRCANSLTREVCRPAGFAPAHAPYAGRPTDYIEMDPSLKSVRSSHTLTRTGLPAFAAARARTSASETSADFVSTMPFAPKPAATSS